MSNEKRDAAREAFLAGHPFRDSDHVEDSTWAWDAGWNDRQPEIDAVREERAASQANGIDVRQSGYCDECGDMTTSGNPCKRCRPKTNSKTVTKNKPKTVPVRIALAINAEGDWQAVGWKGASKQSMKDSAAEGVHGGDSIFWIMVDVPLPSKTIRGKVEPE